MSKILRQIIFYALLVALWQFLFSLKLWPQYLFPSPGQVAEQLGEGFRNRTLFLATGVSLQRLFAGYIISVFLGVVLGFTIGKVKILDETIGGFFFGLQALPSICWLPLAILWFGKSEWAIACVVIIGSLLSITIATDNGVKNIEVIYLKVGQNMGAKGSKLFLHVVLPAAFPSILMGLKQGWLFAWRSLMAAEIITAGLGLGSLLSAGRELHNMSQVIAMMIVITMIGMAVNTLFFDMIEKKVRQVWGFGSK